MGLSLVTPDEPTSRECRHPLESFPVFKWWYVVKNMLKYHLSSEYLEFIYPRELEIKETTEIAASSSYLDYLYIDNAKLTTRLYDKRDEFSHC